MDFEKAVGFIRSTGNAVEQARLLFILTNKRPVPEVIANLFTGQQPDGGWAPFWAQDYSSLDATCFRLARTRMSTRRWKLCALCRWLAKRDNSTAFEQGCMG